MNTKKQNKSHRLLFLSGGKLNILASGYQEMERQVDEGRKEYQAVFKGETIKECPCGCELKNDICETRHVAVKAINDSIPF